MDLLGPAAVLALGLVVMRNPPLSGLRWLLLAMVVAHLVLTCLAGTV